MINKNGLWYMIGVASATLKNCTEIAVFTRVSLYTEWIYKQINSNS